MKKLTRKNLNELAKTMPLISEDVQKVYMGGQDSGRNTRYCVFNFFNYLDGNRHDNDHYVDFAYSIGVVPDNSGGIPTAYLGKIGAAGGFGVSFISDPLSVTPNGQIGGDSVLLILPTAEGDVGHAVKLTSISRDSKGQLMYNYYDPTINKFNWLMDVSDIEAYRVAPPPMNP